MSKLLYPALLCAGFVVGCIYGEYQQSATTQADRDRAERLQKAVWEDTVRYKELAESYERKLADK